MSIALARKYRPRDFASVAVQSHVSNTLKGAIARGRVAHGYLLCGPRGTGKTTLARVLAMALNCERRLAEARQAAGSAAPPAHDAGEPCGECASCQRIWSGAASLDVVEIDAASNRGVDDARELRERAMYAPSGDDGYKVYIVDEAHMLTREAWNALLKVLEEPPPRVVFVFATTEPQKIAQTAAPVLSRLQRFDLKRIGPAEIRERLALVLAEEGVTAEPEALAMIARAADGGLRDALSLTDQVLSLGQSGAVTAERVREALGLVAEDEYVALLDVLAQRRAGDVFATVARLADAGVDFAQFLGGLADVLRAQLAIILGGATPDLSDRLRTALEERRADFAAADMLRMLGALTELEPRFRRSAQQRLLLETLLVRFALLDRTVSLEEVLRGLGNGGGAPAPSAGRGGAPPLRPSAVPGGEPGVAPRADARAEPGADSRAAPRADVRPSAPPSAPPPAPLPEPRAERPRSPEAAPAPATRFAPDADAPPRLEDFAPIDDTPVRGMPRVAPGVAAGGAAAGGALPDVNRLAEQWDDVAAELRRAGQALLASQLANALPVAVSATGVVTVQPEDDMTETAIDRKKDDVLAALRAVFPGVERLAVRRAEGTAAPAQRLTAEAVRAEKMNTLRRRDPALGAAIDALDLELLE